MAAGSLTFSYRIRLHCLVQRLRSGGRRHSHRCRRYSRSPRSTREITPRARDQKDRSENEPAQDIMLGMIPDQELSVMFPHVSCYALIRELTRVKLCKNAQRKATIQIGRDNWRTCINATESYSNFFKPI